MHTHIRTFIFFLLFLTIVIALKFYHDYQMLGEMKKQIVKDETKSLSTLLISFREVYQDVFLKHEKSVDEKTLDFLPAKTIPHISNSFAQKLGHQTTIRTISERPRNPKNKPTPQELEVIEYFENYPREKEYFEQRSDYEFFYAKPLYIQEACLKCHGKREESVSFVAQKYDKAYDYQVGDLRGLLTISMNKEEMVKAIDENYFNNLKMVSILYIIFSFALYKLIKMIIDNEEEYRRTLEEKVTQQVKEIRKKDELLFQQSKMASIGEMIGNIAHQWRQPLSTISSAASGMKLQKDFGKLDDKNFDNSVMTIVDSTQHLSKTIDDFRNFFMTSGYKATYNIKEIIDETLSLVNASMKDNFIDVQLSIEDKLMISGYKRELMQGLLNIFNNAKDALKEKQSLTKRLVFVNCYCVENKIYIKIKDNGGGIDSEIIERIFEPYFTTKHQSQGTGIGLYMTNQIIVDHMEGSLSVKNVEYMYEGESYNGAEFTICINELTYS